jgi:hypothetical protein
MRQRARTEPAKYLVVALSALRPCGARRSMRSAIRYHDGSNVGAWSGSHGTLTDRAASMMRFVRGATGSSTLKSLARVRSKYGIGGE